jgi:putative endonuclease
VTTYKFSKRSQALKEIQYFVYIMTNQDHTVLYTGVTNDLQRRVIEHRSGKGGAFSKKYKIYEQVYFESGTDIKTALYREKQIKAGSRKKKIELNNSINPDWEDLFIEFYGKSSEEA